MKLALHSVRIIHFALFNFQMFHLKYIELLHFTCFFGGKGAAKNENLNF